MSTTPNRDWKFSFNKEEPKKVEAEIPVATPEPVVEEPAPEPEPPKPAGSHDKSKNII